MPSSGPPAARHPRADLRRAGLRGQVTRCSVAFIRLAPGPGASTAFGRLASARETGRPSCARIATCASPTPAVEASKPMSACTRVLSRRGLVVALAGLAARPLPAAPSNWPQRALKLIVPFPPGGGINTLARTIGQRLAERLGQPVVVENRPGAAGNIGMESVARAAPDGYTWLLTSTVAAINPSLTRIGFDPRRELTAVAHVGRMQVFVFARTDLPVSGIGELLALIRSRPGQLSCGTAGGITRLAAEQLRLGAGAPLIIVEYKGTPPALADLAAGHIDLAIGLAGSSASLLSAGRIKALSGGGRGGAGQGSTSLADLELEGWYGLFGPGDLPSEVVARLNREVNAILAEPEVLQRLRDLEIVPAGGTPARMAALLESDTERFRRIAQAAGLGPE